ncbi:unnamed protein product [Closterium sp. NIES-64]|nr:unnamed protein product [Closterium sp. NIES-64]
MGWWASIWAGGRPYGLVGVHMGWDLQANSLSGTIPAFIGNLTALLNLKLNDNAFSGSIPGTIGNLIQLSELDLQGNSLSGTIPAFIGRLTELRILKLNDNAFSGSIPGTIGNLIQLSELDFEGNQFTGELPSFDHMGRLNIFPRSFSDLTATESRLPLNATGGDEHLQHRSLYTAVVEEALSVLQAPPNLLLLQLLPLAVLLQLALALSLAILRRLKNRPPTRYFFSRRALAARQAAMDVEIT